MFPWLVYSRIADGAFCKACSLFAKSRNNLGTLIHLDSGHLDSGRLDPGCWDSGRVNSRRLDSGRFDS